MGTQLYVQLVATERGPKPFKFYNSWIRSADFNQLFRETRSGHLCIDRLQQKLKWVKNKAKEWSYKQESIKLLKFKKNYTTVTSEIS